MTFDDPRSGVVPDTAIDSPHRLTLVVGSDNRVVHARGTTQTGGFSGSPGEFFSCVHADEPPGGCGTTDACMFCGVAEALKHVREQNAPLDRECTIHTRRCDVTGALNYRVHAIPFAVDGDEYVLLDLEDIADRKRREVLERVFYHDVLNTATGLRVYLDLLRSDLESDDSRKIVSTLSEIVDGLVDEINSQRMITSAENGTLETQPALIDGREIAEQAAAALRADAAVRNIDIIVATSSASVSCISDATILRRVLINAIKNAVEASVAGDIVSIGAVRRSRKVEFAIHNPAVMDEEIRLQLFKRFYSTKGTNRGLGTYSMMLFTEHYLHGTVRVESRESDGTTVRIVIPEDFRT